MCESATGAGGQKVRGQDAVTFPDLWPPESSLKKYFLKKKFLMDKFLENDDQ